MKEGILKNLLTSIKNGFYLSFAGSIIFYVISNFWVFVIWDMYPKTFLGLIECYVMAIPFFINRFTYLLFYIGFLLSFTYNAFIVRLIKKQ